MSQIGLHNILVSTRSERWWWGYHLYSQVMDDGDYDGTIMMTTMTMTIMTTMTMRMMKSRNIHPPQPRVGKEGSGRHLRYLILLQPAGDGGVLFVFLFPFSYLSQLLSVFVQLAWLYVFRWCFRFSLSKKKARSIIWAFKCMLGTFVCCLYTIIELYHYICDNSHLSHIDGELGRDCGKTPIPVICS